MYNVTKDGTPSNRINCTNFCLCNAPPAAPNRTLTGGVSSVIIYSSVLSDADRQKVEGYLAWKWWDSGSAILNNTINHSYYSVAPSDISTIFNAMTYT